MTLTCEGCRKGAADLAPFTMAFQPIVDVASGRVFAHEALVRGMGGNSAASVLAQMTDDNRYAFDQQCRVKAIGLAAELGLGSTLAKLSINFMPNAVYEPRACIRQTLAAAERIGLPPDRIIFEFTEDERLDAQHLLGILRAYREIGFLTAVDDFGAGYAGLELLTRFKPDIAKLDMQLIRGIDRDPVRRDIVGHLVRMMEDLGVTLICEGVETLDEYRALRDLGVTLMQGYLLARPAFEALAEPVLPV
ncbi:MAG: EAL domain-containing protein [Cereibacter changlensis]|uniref:EAL domain-containing protein (Putative c-di-GMP-specific phosphodiesterase class I) n=2 Tax=Cereibacter changlensis TaxID=402884 RepID=A0A2W7QMM7_9RHOB|nr:EAL domain-containing protein [Cereibacter changlensis]PZX49703.1 EAL domain-containing protein (putative c-di-GMP-specific phosphodiesterase class I) [Cereibacter changlensis]